MIRPIYLFLFIFILWGCGKQVEDLEIEVGPVETNGQVSSILMSYCE